MADLRTIVAIDQGTTSSRAILFDETGAILAQQSAEFPQIFPDDGWVEQDPEAIWQTTMTSPAPWSKKLGPAAAFPSQ